MTDQAQEPEYEQEQEQEQQAAYRQFPVKLNLDDMMACQRFIARDQKKLFITVYFIFAACALIVTALQEALGYKGALVSGATLWGNILATLLLVMVVNRFYRRIYARNTWPEDSYDLADRVMTFSVDGIHIEQSWAVHFFAWPLVKQILRDKRAFYLVLDKRHVLTVPYRCLPDGISPDLFMRDLERFRTGVAG